MPPTLNGAPRRFPPWCALSAMWRNLSPPPQPSRTVMKNCATNSYAGLFSTLKPIARTLLLKCWSGSLLKALFDDWRFWARPEQLPPSGDWRVWAFIGGRGAGKTRSGSEWVSRLARKGLASRVALIGPTFQDVREVMIEGASGLRSITNAQTVYEASRKGFVWPKGDV